MKYAVLFERTDTGYSAYAPDLPGCVAAGPTLQRTAELMRGAIDMHLEGMREDGDSIPKPTTVADSIEILPAATGKVPARRLGMAAARARRVAKRSKRKQIA